MGSEALNQALEGRYRAVCRRIEIAARECGRLPSDVTLVVASKTRTADELEVLIGLGHRVFGENRVQEAQKKWPALKEKYPDLRLHLIGPLQTNKVRDACELFDVIETIDREKLAKALAEEENRTKRHLRYLIEVNIGHEEQKSGVLPDDTRALLTKCRSELGLDIGGFMCIPPAERQASPYFAQLARMAAEYGVRDLSMGMTSDYPLAIALGATHVRVGTAIFGPR